MTKQSVHKNEPQFVAVRNTNRKRIRGLWQHGEKFYLQVRIPDESTPRRFPLEASTLSDQGSD